MDFEMGMLAPMPANLTPMRQGIYTLVQAVIDELTLDQHKPCSVHNE